ncbi:hypothetical protein ACXR0O_14025 [Verrucomicrobiota bacterium sgz303538]
MPFVSARAVLTNKDTRVSVSKPVLQRYTFGLRLNPMTPLSPLTRRLLRLPLATFTSLDLSGFWRLFTLRRVLLTLRRRFVGLRLT